MGLARAIGGTIALLAGFGSASAKAPLHDQASLNIGLNCQWQQRCMADQQKAMERSLKYVEKKQPPAWKIQRCNKNASRNRYRVDWVGYNNCLRNASLAPLPARPAPKRARHSAAASSSRSIGERGH